MHNSSTAGRKGPDTDPWSYGVETQGPETPQYECVGGYHRTWDQTDPWSLLNPLINGVEGTWDQSIADKCGWVLRCIVKHLEEIKKSRWGVMIPLKKPATRYTDP